MPASVPAPWFSTASTLLQLQDQKRALVRDVLAADAGGKALTLEDLKFLFGAGR
ncbi:MAG: hypothetical protein VKQ33_03145 [Candidatus Sericytochromatia bacterium]|nr:hypothetical protein [Candidatus Sericytochromatia bacterium]